MIHISWWGWRYNETTSSRPLVLCLKEARRSLGIKNSRACLRSNDGIKWWGGRGGLSRIIYYYCIKTNSQDEQTIKSKEGNRRENQGKGHKRRERKKLRSKLEETWKERENTKEYERIQKKKKRWSDEIEETGEGSTRHWARPERPIRHDRV